MMNMNRSCSGRKSRVSRCVSSAGNYRYGDAVRRDICAALGAQPGLSVATESFVFDDGKRSSMVKVEGVIDVLYKENQYHMPVAFWIRHDYPDQPPLVFVQPTKEMQIKCVPGYVADNGRVWVAYLHNWKMPGSNLLGLIQACRVAFGEAPPLYAKKSSRSSELSCSAEETELRITLLSAVESLVKKELSEEFCKTTAEVSALHAINRELLDNQEALHKSLRAMEQKEDALLAVSNALRASNLALEKEVRLNDDLQWSEDDELPVADEMLHVSSTLHSRALDALVSDAAIDDAIFALGEALHEGRLECDVYLKKIRQLARKQFGQRAIINLCSKQICFQQNNASSTSSASSASVSTDT